MPRPPRLRVRHQFPALKQDSRIVEANPGTAKPDLTSSPCSRPNCGRPELKPDYAAVENCRNGESPRNERIAAEDDEVVTQAPNTGE